MEHRLGAARNRHYLSTAPTFKASRQRAPASCTFYFELFDTIGEPGRQASHRPRLVHPGRLPRNRSLELREPAVVKRRCASRGRLGLACQPVERLLPSLTVISLWSSAPPRQTAHFFFLSVLYTHMDRDKERSRPQHATHMLKASASPSPRPRPTTRGHGMEGGPSDMRASPRPVLR